jgi:dTDP-4-dehydrorhamnose reductase
MTASLQPQTTGAPALEGFLVTGANGLVGSRVVARLVQAGAKVTAVGRGGARFFDNGIDYRSMDLAQPAQLRALIESVRPRALLHCAAMTDVDACEADPVSAWLLNVRAVEAAALGCRSTGTRLVALSTDYVFDGLAGPYSEDTAPNPRGVYAATKRIGEETALLLAPGCAVARVAVIYSGHKGSKRTFALSAVESFRKGAQVKAFHDQVVSPTLADNAAEMVIGLAGTDAAGVFHCAGASKVSRVDFCRALARKLGADESLVVPVSLAELKLPAPRPLRCALRVEKIQRLLGEGVPLTLDQGLDRFLAELSQ